MYRYAVTLRDSLVGPLQPSYYVPIFTTAKDALLAGRRSAGLARCVSDIWRRRKDWEPWQHYKTIK